MERKDYFEKLSKDNEIQNEFADDIVFARFINYMDKALLHRRINYIKHQEYLNKMERNITQKEWIVLPDDNEACSFLSLNTRIDNKQKMTNAILSLTERQKNIIVSYYYEKKSLKNIADELESTVDCIEHSKQRAIARLKKYLEEASDE